MSTKDMDPRGLGRRSFLLGAGALGAGTVLAGCTSNEKDEPKAAAGTTTAAAAGAAAGAAQREGKKFTLGFSAPAADHGWIAAITKNARDTAAKYKDIDFKATEGTNDLNLQISQVETLINDKVGVLVILPHDGKQLTSIGRKAMDAGIPVINLDRIFDSPLAYRTHIAGDNYGMGVAAGNYIGKTLKDKGVANPVIGEVPGIDSLPLTQARSQGFKDALASYNFKVGPRVPAEFTVETGNKAMAGLLQSASKLDAVWNHDDDQGIGVLAAVKEANRSEFLMVGGAGSRDAMDLIKADSGVLKATVTYSPSMASSAIMLARLIANGWGMTDLSEKDVPKLITLSSATITKENVDNYLDTGFKS
ncbi:MAG TPA: substrate-binding domain-containing protein [Mycobacteriales bacterium]|jgi:ribose transport system substrate-binding protein|nr:substrate-binding domain-containing protein [Mycobacteriales bacterium]